MNQLSKPYKKTVSASRTALTFCGGTGSVTGANFLLEIDGPKPFKILVDCGLEQGSDTAEKFNQTPFPYNPADINVLLVTHAHADHIGRIPKLIKDGFRGVIYSTPATRDLAEVMLSDAVHLLSREASHLNQPPLYDEQNVQTTFTLWHTISYYIPTDIGGFVSVLAKDSGHILGAAMYELHIGANACPNLGVFSSTFKKSILSPLSPTKKYGEQVVVFTGDLGNSPALFLRDTDSVAGADYLVMESVYGDRNHESKEDRRAELAAVITDTVTRKRTLIIPAFSLERTQDILFEINELERSGKIPSIPIYMDSPLAEKVTEIYHRYSADFNDRAKQLITLEKDIFTVPKLKIIINNRDSQRVDTLPSPKIIMAGSGMSVGGRIIRHERHFLPDPNTTLLLVGYQAVGTLGRQFQDNAKEVTIDGERVLVKAEIKTILGYSSHKDSDHLIEFVATAESTLKKVFVTMGEPKSELFLAQRLRDYIGVNAVVPKLGDTIVLS